MICEFTIWLKRAALLVLFSTLNFHLAEVFAQGSLTPPGAPGPTMVTLSQVEPRTPISTVPYFITTPGSYYLTTNLTLNAPVNENAILISANNVTLDMRGFSISLTQYQAPAIAAIGIEPVTNITIINGFINGAVTNSSSGTYGGSGFGSGIYGPYSVNVRVSGVSVSGCLYNGISLSMSSTMVDSCMVNTAGSYGIVALSIFNSVALNCGSVGIDANSADNCTGTTIESGGISIEASMASNCYGYASASDSTGIFAYELVNNSVGYGSTGINADIANGCYSSTGDGEISYHYNMP